MDLTSEPYSTLARLEHSLWRAETRGSRALMEETFAGDFFEFGRSGRVWQRSDMLFDHCAQGNSSLGQFFSPSPFAMGRRCPARRECAKRLRADEGQPQAKSQPCPSSGLRPPSPREDGEKNHTARIELPCRCAPIAATLPLPNLRVILLDAATALVTYDSIVTDDTIEHARRSSVWSLHNNRWRLRFHQGTPYRPTEQEADEQKAD